MTAAEKIIREYSGAKIRVMEVCGTHTHEIFRHGIRKLLPEDIELITGPGCPVCVTPVDFIDEALWLAERGITITTFGDLVRVPGSEKNLAAARSSGAKVKIVYSPLDAVAYAAENPDEQVVFLSVGFETTVPAACLAVEHAKKAELKNFSLLTANKTMPETYGVLAGSAEAFLYPGHVSAITGTSLYETLKQRGISGVVAGFTAEEIIRAISVIVENFKKGEPFFENCYSNVVKAEGNPAAVCIIERIMTVCDSEWRGLGIIPKSGLKLNAAYKAFDTRLKFEMPEIKGRANPACRCGEVLRGDCMPYDCPLFGKLCSTENPVGACMVSSEGACSAYFKYGMETTMKNEK
ncbi:MAG: hydrogenase formation protein HypD [Synergistaceae bacterium]|nr:hydrogenase formation protein HypD [Synergistaceae bacterium]